MNASRILSAAAPSPCSGRLAIEATQTLKLLASRILVRGLRTILNSCRALSAGSSFPFFHRALRVFQDFARDWTEHLHSLHSAPTWGLVAHSDGHRDSERKIGNVRKAGGEIRNVIR